MINLLDNISSMIFVIVILFIALIVYCSWSILYEYNENVYVISSIDNQKYMIRRGKHKSEQFLMESANTLAEINSRITTLINHLENTYNDNHIVYFLKRNYNFDKISEAAYDTRYTTYTINKNEMHICLRTRDYDERLYDINLLMYVILHELAHMCNYDKYGQPIIGHGREFKQIFNFLVNESINLGLYIYTDYKKTPVEYCGMYLNTQIT
jgi:predicted SprT family Zn-dependent metalloprotease